MENKFLGEDDLDFATETRLPVCLCLDTSGSMFGCIEELNDAVNQFYKEILENDQAANSADIAIVTFDSRVNVAEDFSLVTSKERPHFTAQGGTDMAGGIQKALEILDARKAEYKEKGREYFQPWLVIMSDGMPNDPEAIPFDELNRRVNNKVLTVYCFAIGGANEEYLKRISPRTMRIKNGKLAQFFVWLGKSVGVVSASNPGDHVDLPSEGVDDFFKLN